MSASGWLFARNAGTSAFQCTKGGENRKEETKKKKRSSSKTCGEMDQGGEEKLRYFCQGEEATRHREREKGEPLMASFSFRKRSHPKEGERGSVAVKNLSGIMDRAQRKGREGTMNLLPGAVTTKKKKREI